LHDLFEEFCTCFNDADAVYVTDVYAAGEEPMEGVDADALIEGLTRHGHRKAQTVQQADLAADLKPNLQAGDMVVFLGAGDITNWAYALEDGLDALSEA
jgi:UDP-N-acetylmuramate--alanine ligase